MRWCASLAMVLVALLVVATQVVRRVSERRRASSAELPVFPIGEAHDDRRLPVEPTPVPPAGERAPNVPRPLPPRHQKERGIGHIRGRLTVTATPDEDEGLLYVTLAATASDGSRSVQTRAEKDGHFAMHLPPGTYAIKTVSKSWIGEANDVAVVRDAITDVEISLSPRATSTERKWTIRGAIGFPRGELCPISSVEVHRPNHADDAESLGWDAPGPDCRFEIEVSGTASTVVVVASGPGWKVEEDVAVPPAGDPDPICLNPPCRSDPLEGFATLHVEMAGVDAGTEFHARATAHDGAYRCTGTGSCDVRALPAGATLIVSGSSLGCAAPAQTIKVVAGMNRVQLGCEPERMVHGIIRHRAGLADGEVSVRCGGAERVVRDGPIFSVRCRAAVTHLEYRPGPQAAWRTVPIPAAGAQPTAPVVVEIQLDG